MQVTAYDLLCYFLIYAFLGWCMEVAYATVVKGIFVNRGFLNGPVCPIYGVGGLIVILSLSPLKDNIFLLFVGSVVLTSVLEYVTGYVLEKVFHEKWWDYSDSPYNLKGYICLRFSLLWGFACVFVIDLIHPMIAGLVHAIPQIVGVIVLSVSYPALVVDIGLTVAAIMKLKKHIGRIEELEKGLRALSDGIGGRISDGVLVAIKKSPNFEASLDELQSRYKRLLEQREGRLLKAFPNLAKIKRNEPLERIKNLMTVMREKYEELREKSAEFKDKTLHDHKKQAADAESAENTADERESLEKDRNSDGGATAVITAEALREEVDFKQKVPESSAPTEGTSMSESIKAGQI